MRFAVTVFVALILWGYAGFAADRAGLPKWIPAVALVLVGVILQRIYALLVNSHFEAVGLPEELRLRLRDDRGVVPLWIAAIGIAARSFMVAGIILPLVEAAGCIVRGPSGAGF